MIMKTTVAGDLGAIQRGRVCLKMEQIQEPATLRWLRRRRLVNPITIGTIFSSDIFLPCWSGPRKM